MSEHWIGKAVSIHCAGDIGVFQGTIKDANSSKIVITKAFRNGLPIKSLDTEVTIMAKDIAKIELIPQHNLTNIHTGPNVNVMDNMNGGGGASGGAGYRDDHHPMTMMMSKGNKSHRKSPPINNNPRYMKNTAKSPTNTRNTLAAFVPSKVEVKWGHMASNLVSANGIGASGHSGHMGNMMGHSGPGGNGSNGGGGAMSFNHSNQNRVTHVPAASNDIHSNTNGHHSNGKYNNGGPPLNQSRDQANTSQHKGEKKKQNRQAFNKNTFATPVDDPVMDMDFDFEKNLALFDKQAIWNEIDAIQKPDVVRQSGPAKSKNYRHDEMILDAKPTGLRQIMVKFQCSQEYVTDEGILIPTLSMELRSRIFLQAELVGLAWERQCDMLSRSTVELAIQLLGGARRFSLKNQHQWPKIVIVCDELFRDRHSDIGFSTGRQLASQGLKVYVYLQPSKNAEQKTNREMELFKATGNQVIYKTEELPSCDLVILATQNNIRNHNVVKWINDSRSPVMAVDPPATGVANINIKCSIIPILPLENINSTCGKLYLCNLSLPDSIYNDAGIKYKSPFGHKFIIPLHLLNDNRDLQ